MNVDFMRWVDKNIGVPICLVLSGLNILFKPFKKKTKNPPEKILFIQISEMGSAVVVSPAIELIKKKYPKAEISYLIFDEMSQIIKLIGQIDKERLYTIRGKSFFLMMIDVIKVVLKLRKQKFDVIIDIELFSRVSAILSFLIGARDIIGFNRFHMEGLYRGNFLTKKIIYNHNLHISQNYLSCIYAIEHKRTEVPLLKRKIPKDEFFPPQLNSTEEDRENIIKILKSINPGFDENKKIVIVNPNASLLMPLRKWPIENYIGLVKKIISETDAFVVLTGTEPEKEDTIKIYNSLEKKNKIIETAGKTNLKELIDLYNISDVIITNDSGPGHFAALTKIKDIVLFGPETPDCYKPISKNIKVFYAGLMCSPCVSAYNHRKSSCNNNLCMKKISVEEVFAEVKKSL